MGTAYAKIGAMGFAGSGKTRTAALIAAGLAKASKSKTVAFYDSEKGSDFVQKIFDESKLELLVHKGRAFADLTAIIRECEKEKIQVLIIDSISHVWKDLCDSYLRKSNKRSMTMMDWNILKKQWSEFTDLYINSHLHIIMCGRAGYEYEQQENENTGKKEMVKAGTKMKVEGETGFEPDLLIEMERVEMNDRIINRAWILKDRSDTMNGKSIDYPNFDSFKSFFGFINIGGAHAGVDTSRNSDQLFDDPDWSQVEVQRRREIALDEIKAAFIKGGLDGTSTDAKKKRVETMEKIFETGSWTAVENMRVRELEARLKKLNEVLGFKKEQPRPEAALTAGPAPTAAAGARSAVTPRDPVLEPDVPFGLSPTALTESDLRGK